MEPDSFPAPSCGSWDSSRKHGEGFPVESQQLHMAARKVTGSITYGFPWWRTSPGSARALQEAPHDKGGSAWLCFLPPHVAIGTSWSHTPPDGSTRVGQWHLGGLAAICYHQWQELCTMGECMGRRSTPSHTKNPIHPHPAHPSSAVPLPPVGVGCRFPAPTTPAPTSVLLSSCNTVTPPPYFPI